MKKQHFSEERFFYSDETYKVLLGVFEQYSVLTDRFVRVVFDQYDYKDAPYWHIERTNIGMFAAACWANGWIALEEYTTEKVTNDSAKSVKKGRCDLWISSQDGKENFAIEAKKGCCSLASNDLSSILDNLLEEACNDASKLSEEEGNIRLGVAFMHVDLAKSKQDNVLDILEGAISQLEEYSKETGFLYIYLKDNEIVSDDEYMIPGVVIVGRSIEES